MAARLKIVRFCRDYHDVVDAAFLRDFPEVSSVRPEGIADLAQALAGADVLLINDSFFTPEVAETLAAHGQSLKWIQFTTVGTDHAEAAGIPAHVTVSNIGDVRQRILAGHAIGMMLAVLRGFRDYEPYRARHQWARDDMMRHVQVTEGANLVICGMGKIGQDIARKARAFDMTVTCVTRAGAPATADIGRVVARERVMDVLPEADVIMIAMPLDDATRGFIGARELVAMKPSAILVNISRGPVVDEAALIECLRAGAIRGAALDVFEDEPLPADSGFWDLPNLLMTPHMGGQGGDDQFAGLARLVRDNLRRYLDGKPLKNVIKTPAGAQST